MNSQQLSSQRERKFAPKKIKIIVLLLLLGFILGACATEVDSDIEIMGTWVDNYSTTHSIGNESWQETGTAWDGSSYTKVITIHRYDDLLNYLIYQEPADDPYNANQYGKKVWTEIKNSIFYYCTVVYGKESIAAVEQAEDNADSSDPDNCGCGGVCGTDNPGFAWTKMSKP